MSFPKVKQFTLGGLMAKMPKGTAVPRPRPFGLPTGRRSPGTLRLKRLPLSKVKMQPGY